MDEKVDFVSTCVTAVNFSYVGSTPDVNDLLSTTLIIGVFYSCS